VEKYMLYQRKAAYQTSIPDVGFYNAIHTIIDLRVSHSDAVRRFSARNGRRRTGKYDEGVPQQKTSQCAEKPRFTEADAEGALLKDD
jgi:hypothetical protein